MVSYRTEGLGKAGREGWASPATVSVGTKSTEPGEDKGLEGSRKRQQMERHRQELDRQAADKRWVEEPCEQQSGKQVSQRPRAKQREPKEPGGRYLPPCPHSVGDRIQCFTPSRQVLYYLAASSDGEGDTLLKERVFHRLSLPASKSVKRLSQFP